MSPLPRHDRVRYTASVNSFFAGAVGVQEFLAVTDGGAFSLLGPMDHVSKGLACGPAALPAHSLQAPDVETE